MKAWLTFTKERFEPVSHLLMIGLFFLAHLIMAREGESLPPTPFVLLLFLGTVAFFLKLRLYDEIKDYEVDLKFNPTRPLARGLLRHGDLYRAIAACIAIEALTFGAFGREALYAIAIAIAYSLLMYKEFFIRERIRPYLTTYAVIHTVVSVFLSVALFSALLGEAPWSLPIEYYFFALNNWCVFNIFEFGRKTFSSGEERSGVESYSKIFGRFGAVVLVISMALLSGYLILKSGAQESDRLKPVLAILIAVLGGSGLAYALLDQARAGKAYRALSSVYIIFVYLGWVIAMGVK